MQPEIPRRGRSIAPKKSETPEAPSPMPTPKRLEEIGPLSSHKADVESLPPKLYTIHARAKLENNFVQFVAPDAVSAPKTAEEFQKALQAFEYKNPLIMTFKEKKEAEYWASKHGDFGHIWEISTEGLTAGSVYENPLNPSQILFLNHIPSSNVIDNPFDKTKYEVLPGQDDDEDKDAGGDGPGHVSDSSDDRRNTKPAPKPRKKESSTPLKNQESLKSFPTKPVPQSRKKPTGGASKSRNTTGSRAEPASANGVSIPQQKKMVQMPYNMWGDSQVTTLEGFENSVADSVESYFATVMGSDPGRVVNSIPAHNTLSKQSPPGTPLPDGTNITTQIAGRSAPKTSGPRMHVFGAPKFGEASRGTSLKRKLPEADEPADKPSSKRISAKTVEKSQGPAPTPGVVDVDNNEKGSERDSGNADEDATMSSASKTYGEGDIERILIQRPVQKNGKEIVYYLVSWKADERRPQWVAAEECADGVLKHWRDTQIATQGDAHQDEQVLGKSRKDNNCQDRQIISSKSILYIDRNFQLPGETAKGAMLVDWGASRPPTFMKYGDEKIRLEDVEKYLAKEKKWAEAEK